MSEYRTKYVFAYPNNRRAINGEYNLTEKEAYGMAARLSIEKKRAIVLRRYALVYSKHGASMWNPMDSPTRHTFESIAVFKNGKLDWRV